MTFQLKISGSWETPPVDARPAGIGSARIDLAPIVQRNEPAGRTGTGGPARINAELFAIVGRPRMNTTGMEWWYQTSGIGTQPSMSVEVKLFDPIDQVWHTYSGTMWRPTYSGSGFAGTKVLEFRVRFTNLELIA